MYRRRFADKYIINFGVTLSNLKLGTVRLTSLIFIRNSMETTAPVTQHFATLSTE